MTSPTELQQNHSDTFIQVLALPVGAEIEIGTKPPVIGDHDYHLIQCDY